MALESPLDTSNDFSLGPAFQAHAAETLRFAEISCKHHQTITESCVESTVSAHGQTLVRGIMLHAAGVLRQHNFHASSTQRSDTRACWPF